MWRVFGKTKDGVLPCLKRAGGPAIFHLMNPRTSFTYPLSAAQQSLLLDILRTGNFRPFPLEYTIMAAEGTACKIALYKSGKCVIQGKGASDFVTFTLEPQVLATAGLGYEHVLDSEAFSPHIGIDESGKGDFFGPLVVAGVFVDNDIATAMRDMDLKESKRMTSDKKVLETARSLRKLLGKRYAIVAIGPAAYNRLYAKMRNVNRMLAWAHARAIENLLETVPSCPRAISDQFGSKRQVEQALMKNGRRIELIQRHRAESDYAVAAASVLARAVFLTSLQKFSEQYKTTFPKGASAAVQHAAVELLKTRSPETLLEVAKCHFKTTDEVLAQAGTNRKALGSVGAAVSKAIQRTPAKPKE